MTKPQKHLGPDHQFMKDLSVILSHDAGIRTIAHLLDHYGLFKQSYSQDGHTDYNEGMRSAALYLSQQISICAPQKIPELIQIIYEQ